MTKQLKCVSFWLHLPHTMLSIQQNQPACYITHGNSPSSCLKIFLGEQKFSSDLNPGVEERTAGAGISSEMLFIVVCNSLRRPVMHLLQSVLGWVMSSLLSVRGIGDCDSPAGRWMTRDRLWNPPNPLYHLLLFLPYSQSWKVSKFTFCLS